MDKQREAFIAEIMQLQEAVKKTRSKYLRRDYEKRISRMKSELRQYDKYKKQVQARQ